MFTERQIQSVHHHNQCISASVLPNLMLFLAKLTLLFKGKQLCHAQFPQFSEFEDRSILTEYCLYQKYFLPYVNLYNKYIKHFAL